MGGFGKARQKAAKTPAQRVESEAPAPAAAQGSAVAVFSDTTKPIQFAQGRAQPNLALSDLPDPIDVGDRLGPLDKDEAELLGVCQRALDEFEMASLVAAKALANIRDRRLYRENHSTFEDFVRARWDRSRAWAYQQIDRYQVTQILTPGTAELMPVGHTRTLVNTLRTDGEDAMRHHYEEAKDERGRVTLERLQQTRPTPAPAPAVSTAVHTAELVDAELVDDGGDDPIGVQLAPSRAKNELLAEVLNGLEEACAAARAAGPDGIGVLNSIQRQAARIAAEAAKR